MVERESSKRVKAIRSDRGGEFLGADFRSWLKRHGIKQQLTTAYTSQSNGVAERANLTIIEGGRTILVDSGLPLRFWPLAIRHATVIKNRVLTHVGGHCWVPMEKWSGKKPLVDMLRVFGCMGLMHVPKKKCDKLQAAAVWAVHLGKRDAVRGGAKEGAAKERPKRAAHLRDFLKYERLGVPKAFLVQEEEDEEEKGAEGEMEPICCFGVDLPHEPVSMEEALARDDREAWLASMEDEFVSHMENETWTLTNLPPGRKELDCTWVLRVKTDAEGWLERRKTRLGEEEKVFLLVYVDDILLFSPSLERIKEVQGKLKETFQCKAIGPVGYFLGLHVERDEVKGWLRLHQHKYLAAMGEKYGLEEGRSVKTPLPSGFQLHLDGEEVSQLARVVSRLLQEHLDAAQRLVRVFGLDKFNGDNFAEWSLKMENIFDHYDLLEVMEGTNMRPENDPEKSPWVRKSAQGYLLLGQALGSSQIRHIKQFQREPEKGPKAWAALKGVHSPATAAVAVVLERQMAALRIEEDEAVEEGVQKFFDLLTCLEGADLNYSELQKKTKLLGLLPDSWSLLIINLNRDLPRLSLEDEKRAILQEDFCRRQEGRGAGGGRGRGRGGRGGRGGGAASMKSAANESESRDDHFPGQFFFVSTQAPAGPEKDEGFEEPAAVGKVTLHSLEYWVIDSGATYSMTPRADLLTELEPSPVKHVTSALGQQAEVKGMGKAMFKGADGKMVGLKNVLWVPNLAANLISVRRLQKAGMDTSSKGAKTYTARLGEQILLDLHEDRDFYNEMWQIPVVPMPKERQVAASISTKGETVGSGDGANGRAMDIKSKKCNLGGTSKLGEHGESAESAKNQHKNAENPKAAAEEEYGENMWGTIASAAFSNPTSATGECDWLTLHRRMGHVALPILQQLVKNEMVAGIRVKGEPDEGLDSCGSRKMGALCGVDWKEAKGEEFRFGACGAPLELSSSSTTTRQSSLVNGGEEAKDAEEEEEEVQQEEGRGKRRIQAPNRLTYEALGKPAKSAMAGAALIVGDDEESDYNECAYTFFSSVEMPGEPATLKEDLESRDAEEWKKAMESELKTIEETRTWELVELPEGRKAITSKTLLAGAAIKGWVVKQMDVTTAFLNGVLEENIFMAQPEGFDDGIGRVLKLKKALYGLNQAPRQWYLKVRGVLEEIGFTPSTADHSLFMLGEGEQRSFMVVYVDDILIFSPSSYLVKEVMLKLQDKFKCKAIGDVSFYLGLHIERDVEKRCMRGHQRKYLEPLAAKFGQSEGHVATPFPSRFKCVKEPEEESVGEEERRRFHSLVGSLIDAAVNTRPDVAFATGKT
ncbi:unnamed protein product [Closterium sp. NIES-53]